MRILGDVCNLRKARLHVARRARCSYTVAPSPHLRAVSSDADVAEAGLALGSRRGWGSEGEEGRLTWMWGDGSAGEGRSRAEGPTTG